MLNDSCVDVAFEYFKTNMKAKNIHVCVRNKQNESNGNRKNS